MEEEAERPGGKEGQPLGSQGLGQTQPDLPASALPRTGDPSKLHL